LFILQKKRNVTQLTPEWITEAMKQIHKIYPTWSRTLEFIESIRTSVLEEEGVSDTSQDETGTSHSWNIALKILERFGEGYGRWQAHDCIGLKKHLLKVEESNTGRVPLHLFYGNMSTETSWLFSESVPYLKTLGALDESDPSRLSVIIPNYINSQSNCVAGSKFYNVCCIDECDELISHLERHIKAPTAAPHMIAELIAQLPSDTVSAPRKLPRSLLERLEQIAEHHGGHVPLHGRLFAQWMHHAYPRECSYPHMAGTSKPMTPTEYAKTTGEKPAIKAHEASRIIADMEQQGISTDDADREMPWSSEEELFVCRPGVSQTNDKSKLYSLG